MPIQSPYVSVAMSRLRRAVTVCCWTIGAALIVQTLVWCMATFTQARYETAAPLAKPGTVVTGSSVKASNISVTVKRPNAATSAVTAAEQETAPPPQRDFSKFEYMFAKASSIALAAGTFATIILLPLLALGVLLGVSSATAGVENTVSAFIWSIVVALFILPLGGRVGLPWEQGALTTYSMMTSQVDLVLNNSADAWGGPTFYARFALLPLICVVGLAMVGLRFGAGASQAIIPKESMRLDPVLEKEAANIKPTSLHGGRAANAMRVANSGNAAPERKPALVGAGASNMTSAGEAPRRLI